MDYAAVATQLAELCRTEIQRAIEPLLARITEMENREQTEAAAPVVMPQPKVIVMPAPLDNREREILIHRDSQGRMDGAISRVKA